jgi:hypothetical protein
MKLKTVCASIAVTASIATGMIFVPQDDAQAQNRPNQAKQVNAKTSTSFEIKWFLGLFPYPAWISHSNSFHSPHSFRSLNSSRPISTTKQRHNHKEVPVPVLIPGLAALGAGLIRKHRQEQKQMEME